MRSLFTYIGTVIATATLLISHTALANTHSTHNHDAHVHGYAELTLAIENNKLLINLSIPAHSLIGFEHRAETPKEIAKVDQLKAFLATIKNVLTLPQAKCEIVESTIDVDSLLPINSAVHHEHSTHTEVVIDYALNCNALADASYVTINIFDHYPAIEKIRALWITDKKQGAANLTSNKNILSWK